ncbi:hypothetical protein [Streptomyces sp. NPDC057686]|uniref:hypothetical protein n=1 Tax=Streptomyces sp. NPDC057686 TaxID=3346212 RepID=UPI0036826296
MILTTRARAYVNFGRWVADCPLECGNAIALEPGQTSFFCPPPGGCGHIAEVEWPADPQGIWDALAVRPPKHRNWFPVDHSLAVKAGCPHGQTVADLIEESKANGLA